MLFRDTRLGDDVSPYIADGVKASVLGFQSPFWAVSITVKFGQWLKGTCV